MPRLRAPSDFLNLITRRLEKRPEKGFLLWHPQKTLGVYANLETCSHIQIAHRFIPLKNHLVEGTGHDYRAARLTGGPAITAHRAASPVRAKMLVP